MRALIVADIHSNLEALQSVIKDAERRGGFDQVWSLGDVVGYGPHPTECVDLIRRYDVQGVAGNHDLASIGALSAEDFNPEALEAVKWTATQLTSDHVSYFQRLPVKLELGGFTLVHGSPRDPLLEYLRTPVAAMANFPHFTTPRCLVGHSHISFVCRPHGDTAAFFEFPLDTPVALGTDRLIVNPGAVGQPRDRDPRASYAIYHSDDGVVSHHRVAYDIAATQRKMSERGLPRYLIERLAFGL